MKVTLQLPKRDGTATHETLEIDGSLVFIGANGSGKSRLGTWMEKILREKAHRISAQRALNIPNHARMFSLEQAENHLRFGLEVGGAINREGHRWGGQPATFMLNDYELLLSRLFASQAKRNEDYVNSTKGSAAKISVPESDIDKIIRVWNEIMPQREIMFSDNKVTTKNANGHKYHGKEMSDGERVMLYLIGQCLSAPANSFVIIDEPEIHLHKSLMSRVWDKIEEICPDKFFIYITHDLDFAASRKEAKKIWIKEFDGANWTWEEIPEVEAIPENLMIEIVGSRRNTLFCEGEKGSNDVLLYRAVYPNYHIVPRGDCHKVIESTRALQGVQSLHHLSVRGIIDRDFRADDEIQALKESGIEVLDVAEVENLFCIEPLLRIVAEHLGLDPDKKVVAVRDFIIGKIKDEFEVQVTSHAEREIQFRLNVYTKLDHSKKGLIDGYAKVVGSVSPERIYDNSNAIFEKIVKENDLHGALRHYNRKSLPRQIAGIFNLKGDGYIALIIHLLKGKRRKEITDAIAKFTPAL